MNDVFVHKPIMLKEIIDFFCPLEKALWVDATAGGGGHLFALAQKIDRTSKLIAIDQDERALKEDSALKVRQFKDKNILFFNDNFANIQKILAENSLGKVDGLLCDLGVSSYHLDSAERGFSFKNDGPLDMRMDQKSGMTAFEFLKSCKENELADILYHLGDERKSRVIARYIKSCDLENSTVFLANLVARAKKEGFKKTHPATKTFQAIRMHINDELGSLTALLNSLPNIINKGGVVLFITFHSIEDRIVKNYFKSLSKDGDFILCTKKPITPSKEELAENRRARSAKLRVIKRSV